MKKLRLASFGKAAEHESRGGEIDHGLGVSGLDFVVLGETPKVTEPGESAFDDPALGQHHEAMRVDSVHDVGGEFAVARQRRHPVEEASGVIAVYEDGLQPAKLEQKRLQQFRSVAVLQSGLMHHATQNQPEGIHQEMPFSSADFLARIEAALSGLANHLNALAVDDRSGRGFFLPAFSRTRSRSVALSCCHTPSACHFAK